MSENTDPESQQKTTVAPEYLKFLGLLVVVFVAILVLVALSPRISEVTPAVLGLDGAPAGSGQELPAAEEAPVVGPGAASQPESAAAPEEAPPATGLGGLEAEVEGVRHEVQPGQTLFQVAELYGVSVQELAAANNLINPLQLEAGVVLIIPQSP